MRIIHKTIKVIDYANEQIRSKVTPDSFNEYIQELIAHINGNENVREYKTYSNSTEVVSAILSILQDTTNEQLIGERNQTIAERLLRKEMEAQNRISRLRTNVKRGSLIQALLYYEDEDRYAYLIAKVEHSEFVDDIDYSYKTGFSKDKKTIWKSCLIDLRDPESGVFYSKVYSDTAAKYWSHDFLELVEINSDEANTQKAFNAVESVLNRTIKPEHKIDYTILRNSTIQYFKSHAHFDYSEMIDSVFSEYSPCEFDEKKKREVIERLRVLPEKKKFDCQFNTVSQAINKKIKKVYIVNPSVEMRITDSIHDIRDEIMAYQASDGKRYLRLLVTDEETYKYFKRV